MNFFLISIFILLNNNAWAQAGLSKVDSVCIKRANNAVSYILRDKPRSNEYLIFCYANNFLYVAKNGTSYTMYKGEIIFNFKTQREEVINIKTKHFAINKIFAKCFLDTVCKPQFVFTASDSIEAKDINSDSGYVYFVISKFTNKVCKFNIPITYNLEHRNKMSEIPLTRQILKFLLWESFNK